MRYVIVARAPSKAGNLQYFVGDGFRSNLLQAARFRTEQNAERRARTSLHCRRMIESGALIEVRRLSSHRKADYRSGHRRLKILKLRTLTHPDRS